MTSFSAKQIAEATGGRIANSAALGAALESIRIEKPAELAKSRPSDIAFFFAKSYQSELPRAGAGIIITGEPFVKPLEASGLPLWKKTVVIACPDPYLAMALVSKMLAPHLSRAAHVGGCVEPTRIHPTAVVDESAKIGECVQIGAHCVIEGGARIGKGTTLYPRCYVGENAVIGESGVLFPGVTLYERTQIGDRARIHAGAVLGADGFGYAPRREGVKVVDHEKIYHLGRVVVGNDVEIGANSCIDRGTIGDTVIGDKVKIDDQVMIGHNCKLDTGAVICGNAGLAGRAQIGKFTYIGGMAGVGNDVEVGDGAMVGALSVVASDEPAGCYGLG